MCKETSGDKARARLTFSKQGIEMSGYVVVQDKLRRYEPVNENCEKRLRSG